MKKSVLLSILLLTLFGCSESSSLVSEISSSEESSEVVIPKGREGFVNIYAINDYHGRIVEDTTQKENGIAKVSAFLNEQKKDHELEYLFLNVGDLWQDTYESNSNKGACLTEVMEYMDCEAMSLGNHEFDWSIDLIKENRKNAQKCTYLGANIYYYDEETSSVGEQASDICDPYKIVERNGYKIGVIGIIGKSQITSITSTLWTNLTFLDPLDVVKQYSTELRNEKECDLIVLLAHADTSALSYNFCNEITSNDPNTERPYIDCCFTGHTHSLENVTYNEIPFVQADHNGNYVSHMEIDFTSGKPLVTTAESLYVQTENYDENVTKIVNKYITEDFISKRDEVVCDVEGLKNISTVNAGKLQAVATYEKLKYLEEEKGIEIVAAINNGGRTNVKVPENSKLTRGNIFSLVPFTNRTYVVSVLGANLQACLRNNTYYGPNALSIDSKSYYYVACIDYVLLHKNAFRQYDTFSKYDGNVVYIEETYPDEIVASYLEGKTLKKDFFSSDNFPKIS